MIVADPAWSVMDMDLIEIVTSVLVLLLGLASLAAAYIGILGLFGVAKMSRCTRCGHLGLTSATEPLRTCPYCRHEQLFHPIVAFHHAHPGHAGVALMSRQRR
jgi:hypothetical protein